MVSKLGTARKMSELGITTHIASMREPQVIVRIVRGESPGTAVLPEKKKSSVKRWIAAGKSKQNGIVTVNACLFDILKDNKRVISILPVGIEECAGEFKKGDLVELVAANGEKIGIGIARYGADKLREYKGQKDKPEFIHYDHLHIGTGS